MVEGSRSRKARGLVWSSTGVLLAAAALSLGAAGASGCNSSGGECLTTRTYFEQAVWSPFMSSKCTKCHTPDGVAVAEKGAKFVLEPGSYPGFIDQNLATVKEVSKIQYEGKSELLLKPLGQMNHGGGSVLQEGSDEYKALVELVDRLGKGDSCGEQANTTLSTVSMLDAPGTLRKAAIDLAGRLPTADEQAAVEKGGDAALDSAIEGLTKDPIFLTRVREIWNDVLLTDHFLNYGGAALDFMNEDDYPATLPYRDDKNPSYDPDSRPYVNMALAREPLNLITYVITHDKPFTDIVQSNYTVVNGFSAKAYGLNLTFKDPKDSDELQEAQITTAKGVAIPHAGVLSTPTFLNRWQTTPTNRNRGRARRVYKYFLATDVLKIAERPVDATLVTAEENPTRSSQLCTVCHKVIDPVAGTFRGYDDNDYEHFDPAGKWHDEMFPAGFGGQDMDPSFYSKGLPWLGSQIAADPRFALSAVYTVYKGLTGHDPLTYPSDATALDFSDQLAAWEAQDAFIRGTASALASGNFNLKLVFKAVIKSAYYRGVSASNGTPASLADVGTARLLTPEMLTRKIAAVTGGVRWRQQYEWDKNHDWLLDENQYKIVYGGIDSFDVPVRLSAPNSIVTSVAARMANEMACRMTSYDYTKKASDRVFFPMVELTQVPESAGHAVDGSVGDIKKNIQYLHERILGEKLDITDPEIERTYQLFLDTWHELAQAGDDGLPWACTAQGDQITGEPFMTDDQKIMKDPNFTIRSWMAVVSYLMSDWKFLYE